MWEAWLNELKRTLETQFINEALLCAQQPELQSSQADTLVFCDRGIFDSRAYMDDDTQWRQMLSIGGWEEQELRGRYDAVFHLDTCPEEAYDAAQNAARRESYREAVTLDDQLWAAWSEQWTEESSAASHVRIGNPDSCGFQPKLERLLGEVHRVLGTMERPRQAKNYSQALPVESVIQQADVVATAPDLSLVAEPSCALLEQIRLAHQDAIPVGQSAQERLLNLDSVL